jgi:multicomponent Na+:H+ antiporter subunit E
LIRRYLHADGKRDRAGKDGTMMARTIMLRAIMFAVLWWALTEGRTDSWGIGAGSVLLATAASVKLMPPAIAMSLAGLPGFLGFFLMQSLKGGVQVASMALRPRLDLRPGWLEVPLRLPEGPARVLLAGTMNLLPGTVSAGLERNCLRLHVLDERMPVEREVRTAEERVARLLGLKLQ